MASPEDLSAEQTEKLLQFQDLTGIEEMERCREILSRHNWDMEVAVQSRLNEEEGHPVLYQDQRSRDVRTPQVDAHPVDQRIYTFSRRQPQGFMGWGYFIITFPLRFVYTTLTDILRFVYRLLRPDPRRSVTDPLGDVTTFINKFEEAYGSTHPTFYRGTYSQALNEAKRELKFMLVYLHSEEHQDTPQFCRETLCNEDVVEYINDRVLFWACNSSSAEGYRVSQALRENTYPFLALVVLRDSRMTVVARIEGPIGGEELIARLSRVTEDNEPSLIAARADRETLDFNQSLREEQDRAYLESLRADQEKERRKREEQERMKQEEEEAKQQQEQEKERQADIERRKEQLRDELPEEPMADDADAVRVLLKLPNGTRLERRFLKSHSLKHLANYVFVHEAAPDNFQIVTNFPRRALPCHPTPDCPEPPTFEQFGVGKSEMLFVQDLEA